MRTFYDILGVTQMAPREIISAVYRAWMQALRMHPDLGGSEEAAKEINLAYEVLGDPDRRAEYDLKLAKEKHGLVEEKKRRAPRVAANAKIAFCIPPDGRWLPAETVDASSLGLKINTAEELFVGLHVSVAFPSSVAPAAEAEVRWVKKINAGVWRCEAGLEFFSPVPDILRRLSHQMAES